MRTLFVSLPGVGHVRPMLPLARAMRAAGHGVRFATGADFLPMVRTAGFEGYRAGPTRAEARAERLRRHPDSAAVRPEDQQRFHVRNVWAGVYAPWMYEDLLALVASGRPDLIVHDAMAFAVPAVAAATGVPVVSHSTGPGFARRLLDEAADALVPLWDRAGADGPAGTGGAPHAVPPAAGVYGALHLDVWPGVLQLDDLGDRGEVRPIATVDDEPAADPPLPDWFGRLPDRPTVHFTLGTVFNDDLGVFRTVVEALRDEPLTLITTLGPGHDPADLGPQPDNVHVETWLPHARLLDACDLVVTHGGAGTTLKALRRRLPLLLLPRGADMFRTAQACTGLGIARSLAPDQVEPEAVRDAVRALLHAPGHRAPAEAVGRELDRMEPPEKLVPLLESHADRRRPGSDH